MSSGAAVDATLLRTPLYDLHCELGAKMVPFAGYAMPVNYAAGVLKEHLWTRASAGLFDVSHMGQAEILTEDRQHETAADALETLVPADIRALKPGQQRYTQLLNERGGIIDDLMVTRAADDGRLLLVVNAARKDVDYAHMTVRLPSGVTLVPAPDRALIALQGPKAVDVLAALAPSAAGLAFMQTGTFAIDGVACRASRSGYTGEDGYEISMAADAAESVARRLLKDERVQPIGLGARDSLRLEAGLCLYGHDIDEDTTPVAAGLSWSIQKRRREAGGFPGDGRVRAELANGASRVRVGIRPEGRAPAREGTLILAADGTEIGAVTSGGFGPTVNAPVAMGYVTASHAAVGTPLQLVVRGKPQPAAVASLPFVPHRYAR